MKKSKMILALSLTLGSLIFADGVSANERETVLHNKNGLVLKLRGDNKGVFKVYVKNETANDMFNVSLMSEDIKGFKLVEGRTLVIGDIKAGEEKTLDEKVIKYELEKIVEEAIKNNKLAKTGINGVYKIYIPIAICGMVGMAYVVVTNKKNRNKILSLALATTMLTGLGINEVKASTKLSKELSVSGRVMINDKEYEYAGLLMWNEEKHTKVPSDYPTEEPKEDKHVNIPGDYPTEEPKEEVHVKVPDNFPTEETLPDYPIENIKFVEIEDPLLLKVINKNIDKNREGDEKITEEEITSLKELSIFLKEDGTPDFSENAKGSVLGEPKSLKGTKDFKFLVTRGIKSLKGLEHAVNLEKLKLNENEISDITPLKDLTKLKYLELQRNRITDISPLYGLTNLEFLKLYANLIEDISPLSTLVNLTGLDIHYNTTVEGDESNKIISKGITDISAVKNMTKLEFLDVSANRIKDISSIKDLNNMKDLDFSGNNVSDYSDLSEYIVSRYVKQLNEGDGSIGWSSQIIDYSEEIPVTEKNFEIDSKFKGIKEISEKLTEAFESEDPLNLFASIESDVEGVDVTFNPENSKFEFTLSDEFVKAHNNTKTVVNLKISLEDLGWKVKNITLDVNINDNPIVVNENNRDFYFNLFNKYSGGKYVNLTDEANAKFSKTDKPLKTKDITAEDMKMLKSFKVTDKNIDNNLLSPLKYAENLEEFEVLLNSSVLKREATDFSVLENTKLTKFHYMNQDYENLTERVSADFSPLSKVKTLKDVRINYGDLKNLDAFKGLDLNTLVLDENQISDISAVSGMNSLERLELLNNNISDISPISSLPKLITLYLGGNPVSDINPLKTVKTLEAVLLQKTKISNIDVLKELPKLHRLRIDKNNLVENYFDLIKTSTTLNETRVTKINLDEFNWFKDYLIRDAVDATFPEDKVRIGYFDELLVEVEVDKTKVVNGKVEIDNPLLDWNREAIVQSGDENGENMNENIAFNGDKISVNVSNTDEPITENYEIYVDNYDIMFGDFGGQPTNIGGKVKLVLTFK